MAFEDAKQIREYIRKHGSIFGISSKFAYEWRHGVYEFDNYDDAVNASYTAERMRSISPERMRLRGRIKGLTRGKENFPHFKKGISGSSKE